MDADTVAGIQNMKDELWSRVRTNNYAQSAR
jgi:hypothetical protein